MNIESETLYFYHARSPLVWELEGINNSPVKSSFL